MSASVHLLGRRRGRFVDSRLVAAIVITMAVTGSSWIVAGATSTPTWTSAPVRATLPPQAVVKSQNATFNALGCSGVNTCTAVGSYRTSAGNQLLVATELYGHWGAPSTLAAPLNAVVSKASSGRLTELLGVACPALGDCVAVGTYNTSQGFEPLVVSEMNGTWGVGQIVDLPKSAATAGQSAALFAVRCNGVGNCEAVGTYDNVVEGLEPLTWSEHRGTWNVTETPALPTGALTTLQDAGLASIDCPTFGNCVGVGSFVNGTDLQAMALRESNGVWGNAASGTTISLPATAVSTGNDSDNGLNSVSCLAVTTCVAVGQFDLASGFAAMAVDYSSGQWHQAHQIVTPTPLDTTDPPLASLESVSCSSAASCVAVGGYGTRSETAPVVATDSSGSWAPATASALPPDAVLAANGQLAQSLATVSFAVGGTELVGYYRTVNGIEPYTSIPTTPPSAPTAVTGLFGDALVRVSWRAPLYGGGVALSGYTVTASPGGRTCSTTVALTCTVSSLTNGVAYSFSVTAANALGVSAPSLRSSFVTPATKPSAPTIVVTRPLTKGFQLIVSAPLNNGGSPIVTYEYSLNGGAQWRHRARGTTSRILNIAGLLADHTYRLRVRAVNEAGPGAASAAVVAKTH